MITVFIGDNHHTRESAVKDYVDSFISAHGAMAISRFNAESAELIDLIDAVSSQPFLTQKRLIIIRDLSSAKHLVDSIDSFVKTLADENEILLIENGSGLRSKHINKLKEVSEFREFHNLEGDALLGWLIDKASSLGGRLSREVARMLINRVGSNHQTLANELQKLILFNPEITKDSINQMTTHIPQSSVFAMLDATMQSNSSLAVQLYQEQRDQGMEPLAILGMITWQLHILNVIKAAGSMSPAEIASKAKLSPFVVRKNLSVANKISDKKMINMIDQAINANKLIINTSANADDILQDLILDYSIK